MSEVRMAVWGAGVMGERVARAAAALPGVRVAAVVDQEPGRAGRVAGAIGAAAVSTLADAAAEGIDAVYIGLPNAAHRDACLEAAQHELHVLVDKPLTATVRDADDVLAAAAASERFWMMGFSYRFRAEWRRAREIVLGGGIGEPYFVCDDVIEAYRTTPSWYWDPAADGGTLNLQSHHVFDRWEWLLGADITHVSAQAMVPAGAGADLAVTLIARFGSAVVGSSGISFGLGYDAPPRVSFTVQGTAGMIAIDETRKLSVATASGMVEEVHDRDDWLSAELAAFIAGVRGEQRDQPSLAAGRRAVELASAAARSSSDGRWVATESTRVEEDR